MERQFTEEIRSLRLGDGEVFRGEGIVAVTKALLQSGVAYVGGYQGAPVSHLLDVMVQARDELAGLGVHVEACTNEAAACAMLGASINYPARGAVTWKSIVGTNVAADALSNLASAGVVGGALIVVGEDYGEGASVIQERTHAFALKSTVWLADPRPHLPTIVSTVERCFELSEASNAPVIVELRIRACHLQGEFVAKANRAPAVSARLPLDEPAAFRYERLSHPPVTFTQEKLKSQVRLPAAQRFVLEAGMNERMGPGGAPGTALDDGARDDVGIVVQGGLHATLVRALQLAGAADAFGRSRVPILCLNVVHPLVPEQVVGFCAGRRAVLVVEEGQPEYLELGIAAMLRRAGVDAALLGKDVLPSAGEYTTEVVLAGVSALLGGAGAAARDAIAAARELGASALGAPPPPRPPNFCVGCPERPVFAAMKLVQAELGRVHVGADIGCHAFATFEPFSQGNSILGYGMSLASIAGVAPLQRRRPVAVMGDGGFWHNGLLSGVASSVMNDGDAVLVVMKNGYTSATGTQELVSSPDETLRRVAGGASATHGERRIERTLRAAGARWVRTVHTYRVADTIAALRDALTTTQGGLKVVVAEGECQLERQRRIRPVREARLARGERDLRVRYGVDGDVCTGDHACVRLSGCPSLTVRDPDDPLKLDPVAHVDEHCVGCGLCGEVSHAAALCPSFHRVEVVSHPSRVERWRERLRSRVRALVAGGPAGRGADRPGRPDASDAPRAPDASGASDATATATDGAAAARGAVAAGDAAPHEPDGPDAAPIGDAIPARCTTLLIGALGGEGGGVLTGWIVEAARAAGWPVQATSIPGVAQRTGATTYYVELMPVPRERLGGLEPVMSPGPTPGHVDVVLCSEAMEAARALAAGWIGPATTVIASTHRVYATIEKMAMGDGRYDAARAADALRRVAARAVLLDMRAERERAGAATSAVMFGALLGAGALPLRREHAEAVVRAAGIGVDASLRGLAAGFERARDAVRRGAPGATAQPASSRPAASGTRGLDAASAAAIGEARCREYLDDDYARLYRERLARATAPRPQDGALGLEVARWLALTMCYEDIARVAALKLAPARLARIRADARAADGEPVRVVEVLTPGWSEVADALPPALAARVRAWAGRRGRVAVFARGLRLETTSPAGALVLRALAATRAWRRASSRHAAEQALVERWIDAIAGAPDAGLALEIARLGRLVKGYSDTHRRGRGNFVRILETLVEPSRLAPHERADAIRAAREAALADPDPRRLDAALAERGVAPRPVPEVAIRVVRRDGAARRRTA